LRNVKPLLAIQALPFGVPSLGLGGERLNQAGIGRSTDERLDPIDAD
jgi:hypothetical protein